ncbi:WYL domain-containing protein [Bacterioplanes sanyensis]|uniref:helix-turn-helix transcriptional regulator n=1 Tax=Bacterioplanes sanyensis TaxID=1249553 RepID=UPI001673450F|nr:WYL domain-containing protein [Bacterioplanes sanyensis]GGY57537.1 WYL domain-containing protein [Bacterioplanes sanyensis]
MDAFDTRMTAPEQSTLSHQQQQIFKRIELIAQWQGRLNTQDLTRSLGITRQTASKLINEYKHYCPNYLVYEPKIRGYQPGPDFQPRFSSGQFDDYVALSPDAIHADLSDLPTDVSLLSLGGSQRQPSADIVRFVIQAIQQHQRLDIAYASMSSLQDQERIISPHTLINDGRRWHVRAWCEKKQTFCDFVLTRIRHVFSLEGPARHLREHDQHWHTWVSFSIEPDPRLAPEIRRTVALDYDMEPDAHGHLKRHYRVRAALLLYWLQQLRVDRYRERPEAQQIILSPESQSIVDQWLPK